MAQPQQGGPQQIRPGLVTSNAPLSQKLGAMMGGK
jgi:hypothetical protein